MNINYNNILFKWVLIIIINHLRERINYNNKNYKSYKRGLIIINYHNESFKWGLIIIKIILLLVINT